ncbi:MAG: hypothetical protein IPP39_02015 [Chitinophagaceae bacterium]|nr:hypothetical protein [Chitinophagaceae bacterium]
MHAKTIIGINQEDIQVALKESLSDGDKPTLPIVFTRKTGERGGMQHTACGLERKIN